MPRQQPPAPVVAPLWYDSIEDAVRDAVHALGGSKTVAVFLWPDRPVAQAQAHLNDCLNPDRPQRLTPSQLILIAREARARDHHALMHFICRETGYEDARPVTPADQRAELQREFIAATRHLQAMAARIAATEA